MKKVTEKVQKFSDWAKRANKKECIKRQLVTFNEVVNSMDISISKTDERRTSKKESNNFKL